MEKVEIDGETADRIVVCSLRETIQYVKQDIAKLSKKKKRKSYEQEDLDHCIKHLVHLEAVYEYYGGNIQ